MRETTLELLACPDCGADPLELSNATTLAGEIESGVLSCAACGSQFPIVLGIPRLLPLAYLPALLDELGLLEGFDKARTAAGAQHDRFEDSVARTMVGYSMLHLMMKDDEADWEANQRYFEQHTLVPPADYAGKRVLDLGCGDGRFVGCAAPLARETIGFDLSRGVELARRRTRPRGTVDFVQGDIFHLPFRSGSMDLVSSVGVLHHTPDPRAAYVAASRLVADGGHLNIWVYGLDGMRLEYRISHMVPLRKLTRSLSLDGRLQLAFWLSSLLDLGLWAPARAVHSLGLPVLDRVIEKLPVIANYDQPFLSRLRAVFDRVQPPEASYHGKDELEEWIRAAGLGQVEVRTREGRGWLSLAKRG